MLLAAGAGSALYGGQATLLWDANLESDVVGYKLHYGSSSGSYAQSVNVGNVTEATIPDLEGGATYFFVVTAYNSAGQESLASNEVSSAIANGTPVASITAPATGSKFAKRAPITINSEASDSNAGIAKVEFYAAGVKIGEDASAPYSAVWNPKSPGFFEIFAKATNLDGVQASSTPISVEIVNPTKPANKTAYTYSTLLTSGSPTAAHAGAITVTTAVDGSFSGRVTFDGVSHPVKGRLDAQGSVTKIIPRKGKLPLSVVLRASDDSAHGLGGTISDGAAEYRFLAARAVKSGGRPNRNTGRWTVLLPAEDLGSGETTPQGTGFGKMVVAANGSARFTGVLADGTPFSRGGRILEADKLPLYIPLYNGEGAFAGTVQFPTSGGVPATLSGAAEWRKPAMTAAAGFYPAGFRLTLSVTGELVSGRVALPLASQVQSTSSGQEVVVFGGNLVEPIRRDVEFTKSGALRTVPGDEQMKLSVRADGKITGSFVDLPLSGPRRLRGAFLFSEGVGGGFFLGTSEGGGVVFQPVE